jgi:hypothetical protein
VPALNSPVANARSLVGNHSATVQIAAKKGVNVAFADGLVFENVRVSNTEGKLLEETGVQRSKLTIQPLEQ